MRSASTNNLSLTADTQYMRKAGTGQCPVTELLESVAAVHLGLSTGTAPLLSECQVPGTRYTAPTEGSTLRRDVWKAWAPEEKKAA